MTSSMLTGDRRWASGRRGGMTVLGKVAVPKPINLPSQRLENHGMDTNIEIVPKGTYSWGSRSSTSASNAWGSSTLSPNTDGGTGSPSHLSGRPSSSGGSGTRPSTAGSDRALEPIANPWNSNSRPSSASGALTSSQTSLASLRPRSAETRPGSSQLSRFAEPLSDNSVKWSTSGTAEKLGAASFKNDDFSLTSGDFPTLGSEKETFGKGTESQEHGSHGLPGSTSGGAAPGKESIGNSVDDFPLPANTKSGNANSWRRENPPYGEDGARPYKEKWHPDRQPYPNSNIAPQNFDSWRGPPVNNHPSGVWYRLPPGVPPFGPPVGPGGFNMEPFPYYRPQIPPASIGNPQLVPQPGAGPRGPHPNNGDMYRGHMHDAYIRPSIPLRPGFYPGPVPYEGYYGPPMGYCNSNERDNQFMGMAVGPAAYNQNSGQSLPDASNLRGRSSGYAPTGTSMVLEQVESGHPQDTQGPYKVLLKQEDGWEGKDEEQKSEDGMTTTTSCPSKGDHPRTSSWGDRWKADNRRDDEMDLRRKRFGEEGFYEGVDRGVVPLKGESHQNVGNQRAPDNSSLKKLESPGLADSAFQEAATPQRDPSLIQKIEGLNAKARASEGRHDVKYVPSREELKSKLQVGNARTNLSTNEAGSGLVSVGNIYVGGLVSAASLDGRSNAGDRNLQSLIDSGMASSRADHRCRGRPYGQEVDGLQKKPQVSGFPSVVSAAHPESLSVHSQEPAPMRVTEKSGQYPQGKDDGEPVSALSDSSDSHAQRAKMRELAKQRFKQREKEEEERARDQRAKAHAKLEELNRRMQVGDGLIQKLETVPESADQDKQEETSTHVEQTDVESIYKAPSSSLGSNSIAAAQNSENSVNKVGMISISNEVPIETGTAQNVAASHGQSEPRQQDVNTADPIQHNSAPQSLNGSSVYKKKRVGYRQRPNSPLEKNSSEKFVPFSAVEASDTQTDTAANTNVSFEGTANETACESDLPVRSSVTAESSVQHRRKNRSGKNKHKVESVSSASRDIISLDTVVDSEKPKVSECVMEPSLVQSLTNSKDVGQSSEQHASLPNEAAHMSVNNQWRAQHSRRMPRNSQGNKLAEKFNSGDAVVWAPVCSLNKIDLSDEASEKNVVEAVSSLTKNDQPAQNNPRNKRAEIERYIPKPVAKEMAQQGNSHQSVIPSANQVTSDEIIGRPESSFLDTESSQASGTALGKLGSAIESNNSDGRQNKSGKVHGSWRQRGSAESTTANPTKNIKKSIVHQPQKADGSSVKDQPQCSDDWGGSDSWNMPEDPDTLNVPLVKDQDTTARGKRHVHKGHKAAGHKHDSDERRIHCGGSEKVHIQPSGPEMHQAELSAIVRESCAVGERSTSHWQPKSRPYSAANQWESRPIGGQNLGAESSRSNKKDSASHVPLAPQSDKETVLGSIKVDHDQSALEKGNLEEAPTVGHQEAKRESRMPLHKVHPSVPLESSPSSHMEFQHDKRISSSYRKNGNQSNRFGKDHESHREMSGSGKDNRQHNFPANWEKQRHVSHYEYQPVGQHNNEKVNNFETPKAGSYNSSSRFREKSQNHSRRGGGNFHGQQSGNVPGDANYS